MDPIEGSATALAPPVRRSVWGRGRRSIWASVKAGAVALRRSFRPRLHGGAGCGRRWQESIWAKLKEGRAVRGGATVRLGTQAVEGPSMGSETAPLPGSIPRVVALPGADEVGEAGEAALEGQFHRADGAVALFADDDFGLAMDLFHDGLPFRVPCSIRRGRRTSPRRRPARWSRIPAGLTVAGACRRGFRPGGTAATGPRRGCSVPWRWLSGPG